MRILLATDGSPFGDVAVEEVARRPWPRESAVKIVSVVDMEFRGAAIFGPFAGDLLERMEEKSTATAEAVVARAAEAVSRNGSVDVVTAVLRGQPALAIVEEAEAWGADLVVLGSHGRGVVKRFLLGSVSNAVAQHAHCSVEIVRQARRDEAGESRA
jgi:nucleotide-binding universal stress UspA family protein